MSSACPSRVYDSGAPVACRHLYLDKMDLQDKAFVDQCMMRYCHFDHCQMTIIEALKALESFVDLSDPDLQNIPNSVHALQTAAMMMTNGETDEMIVVGLIHDLGKIIHKFGRDIDGTGRHRQFAIVGDDYIIGYPLPASYPFATDRPELHDIKSNYVLGCGLDHTTRTFGHDEYMFRFLEHHRSRHSLSDEALSVIRYHSLYAYHTDGAYADLESPMDVAIKPLLQRFQQYDLYSKKHDVPSLTWSDVSPLVYKYFGKGRYWF